MQMLCTVLSLCCGEGGIKVGWMGGWVNEQKTLFMLWMFFSPFHFILAGRFAACLTAVTVAGQSCRFLCLSTISLQQQLKGEWQKQVSREGSRVTRYKYLVALGVEPGDFGDGIRRQK